MCSLKCAHMGNQQSMWIEGECMRRAQTSAAENLLQCWKLARFRMWNREIDVDFNLGRMKENVGNALNFVFV